ncbi:cell cycle protein [Niallia circulans]|jgi:rod shape determining protein RodA|uniref:Cell cycle protein n=1 Tax=Niallia circulans TaxID=1397 RepID=A0A0J1IK64_NIACI|nr:rod shape-determining protein RodA [Niallia circulans]KLV26341.1 cell cycle protein [Niallia circulans]MCM2982185.1 rod shape-determining protein RodA [Niallia circulans]MDR4317499.1 rod shape-determining protein RodA [Niallia circulans]MED3840590.1 rod shape-determining protein RodA [Niallia circulans]MED4243594.1 rod shape-determining protein RodA [Niallia circulans]
MSPKNSSKIDYTLVLILMLLCLTSLIAIYGANSSYVLKQVMYYVVGIGIIIGVIRLDSDQLKKLTWYLYAFGLFLLVVLIFAPSSIAREINGAKSWFTLPGFSLQPSEFVKVFLVLALSRIIVDHQEKYIVKTIQSDFFLLFKIGAVTVPPLLLVMKQPDLGTSLVFLAIMLGMIFISGISWKILTPIFSSFAVIATAVLYLVIWHPDWITMYFGVKEYQMGRIYSWLDPYTYQSTTGYHLTQSLLAIGSGQTTGKGVGTSEVVLPENHTDFIFSVVGEEFGFIGASIIISLFFLLIYHITKVALETKNTFYTCMSVGIISMLCFHVFQNIGMTVGILPITGIPLPFISYGGSSLMGNMLSMGLIFSIRYHYKKYMFSSDE